MKWRFKIVYFHQGRIESTNEYGKEFDSAKDAAFAMGEMVELLSIK